MTVPLKELVLVHIPAAPSTKFDSTSHSMKHAGAFALICMLMPPLTEKELLLTAPGGAITSVLLKAAGFGMEHVVLGVPGKNVAPLATVVIRIPVMIALRLRIWHPPSIR